MLNEQFLNAVSGGKPFIELVGAFAMLGMVIGGGICNIMAASYQAHDDMGQHAKVQQVKTQASPVGLGSTGVKVGTQKITILNSDNVKDLAGVKVFVGATAELPMAAQKFLSEHPVGLKTNELFGVLVPNTGAGIQGSAAIGEFSGKPLLAQVSTESTTGFLNIGGAAVPINVYVGFEGNGVQVTKVDSMQRMAYFESHHKS